MASRIKFSQRHLRNVHLRNSFIRKNPLSNLRNEITIHINASTPLLPGYAPFCSTSFRENDSPIAQFKVPNGSVALDFSKVIGHSQTRGERPYQEDRISIQNLKLSIDTLRHSLLSISQKQAQTWEPIDYQKGAQNNRQVVYSAVFDGHGGHHVSEYLAQNLHKIVQNITTDELNAVLNKHRHTALFLSDRLLTSQEKNPIQSRNDLSLDELLALSFLYTDDKILNFTDTDDQGSTATVALLYSLSEIENMAPFYTPDHFALTVAQVGDSKAILASSSRGRAYSVTHEHSATSQKESDRMGKLGFSFQTDSFGETRLDGQHGSLAMTRAFGDREFKSRGVIAEPEISKRVLYGPDWAFLAVVSDGVSGTLSDQEIVDLCRGFKDPKSAANHVVKFAEDAGSSDNISCLIVPLTNWGKMGGKDSTKQRREKRLHLAELKRMEKR